MNPAWQEFLRAAGATMDDGTVSSFGNLNEELCAGRDSTIISPLPHLGLIEFTGEDAAVFLHNQLTSDVNHLAADHAQYSAWCSAKGRMLATLLLFRQADSLQALISADLLEGALKRLQMFVLRSRVKLADRSGDRVILGLSGPQASLALNAAGAPIPEKDMASGAFAAGVVIRLRENRFILALDVSQAPACWQQLANVARPASPNVWQWLEIQAGIPLVSAATREAFVPQMANLDKIGGVSFRKGCYPGQEVVARAQYLGKIKRHLYRIHADGAFSSGTALFVPPAQPDQPCGMVVNAAPAPGGGYDALAVIQESFVDGIEARDNLRLDVPGASSLPILRIEAVDA